VRWYDTAGRPLAALGPTTAHTDGGAGVGTGDGSGDGAWTRMEATSVAPDAAASAVVELSTGAASTGTLAWDDVTVTPPGPAPATSWTTSPVGRLDGFATTTTSRILDLQGRPKLLTVVSGAPATFQLVDVQTGAIEDTRRLPGLVHGWALTESLDGRSVYIGAGTGHVARYDLPTRSLTDLGRATPEAALIFDLATAPDGRIWGASYPEGQVWVYDPDRGEFSDLAPVGGGHDYARSIAVDGSWAYVGTGATTPDIVRISTSDPSVRSTIALPTPVDTGFVRSLDLSGPLLSVQLPSGRRAVYDTIARTWDVSAALATSQPVSRPPGPARAGAEPTYVVAGSRLWRVDTRTGTPGAGGTATGTAASASLTPVADLPPGLARDRTVLRTRIDGVLADWLISFDALDSVTALAVGSAPASQAATSPPTVRTFPIRLRPNAVPIKSLAIGSRGEVLVGGFGGSSLSELDPGDPEPRLTPLISDPVGRDAFGEVEGMVSNGRYDFFGSYTSARLFRRDSTQPWVDGTNPVLLASLGPRLGQDRPIAWTTAGERTVFGTIPKYGRLGGVLGWFDGADPVPHTVWSPLREQSIVALSGSGSVVYGGTSRWGGLGVTPSTRTAEVFAYDLDTRRTLWHVAPIDGAQAFAAVLIDGRGRLWAATETTLVELDPRSGAVSRRIPLVPEQEADAPTYRTVDLALVAGRVVVATSGGLYAVDPQSLSVETIAASDVLPPRVRATGSVLYYPSSSTLLRATAR
jgi:hypothetical protein